MDALTHLAHLHAEVAKRVARMALAVVNPLKKSNALEAPFREENNFIFNENYVLKFDRKRIELMERNIHGLFRNYEEKDSTDDIHTPIHPMLGLLLHFFDGTRNINAVVDEYSKITGFDKTFVETFTRNMIDELYGSKKGKRLKFGDRLFYLPKNLLMKNRKARFDKTLSLKDFQIPKKELDVDRTRSYIPTDCLMEINFECFTDCVYCYADRRKNRKCSIPLERLKEIIREAKHLRMRRFDLSGGEVFLYEHWESLLKELLGNGFKPYISTKIPLSETIIKKLKELGVEGIQFSIDSLDRQESTRLLNVPDDYLPNIIKSIERVDKEGIKIAINSQITSINDRLTGKKKMLDFFVGLENIKSIKFGAAGFSIYKSMENYNQIAPSLKNILEIEEFLDSYKEKHKNISISFSGYSEEYSTQKTKEEKEKIFSERARCSGNFYVFVILPDGKVTVCEELYYHPRFLIGDIRNQSIEEVWNSDKALELYNLSREMVREESACNRCEKFDSCHKQNGVCWKNVVIAYGCENWDFPDPKCPIAPKPFNRFWLH